MPRLAEDTQMDVVRVRLPHETVVEVERMVAEAGLYKSYFWQVAAMMGARALLRMMVPEHFITGSMMADAVKAFGLQLSPDEVDSLRAKLHDQGVANEPKSGAA